MTWPKAYGIGLREAPLGFYLYPQADDLHSRYLAMDRRTFLGALAGVCVVAPLTALGREGGNLPRIGILSPGHYAPVAEAFREGLHAHGWVEGQNVQLELRSAGGDPERYPELAVDLVRLKVDVILCAGGPASLRAAAGATKTIPIVMVADSRDPVRDGFVKSFARPGTNITGIVSIPAETAAKPLELLKEAVPDISRVGVVSDNLPATPETVAAAQALGMELVGFKVRTPADFDGAIANAAKAGVGGLLVASTPLTVKNGKQLAEIVTRHRLPAVALFRRQAEAGLLMTYGPSLTDEFRQAATYVDKILKGANPGDLPVEQPTKFELVINLKTAKAIGVKIPPSLLFRADQVIE
jgi:putative ABC transport system substrate-binding protein